MPDTKKPTKPVRRKKPPVRRENARRDDKDSASLLNDRGEYHVPEGRIDTRKTPPARRLIHELPKAMRIQFKHRV